MFDALVLANQCGSSHFSLFSLGVWVPWVSTVSARCQFPSCSSRLSECFSGLVLCLPCFSCDNQIIAFAWCGNSLAWYGRGLDWYGRGLGWYALDVGLYGRGLVWYGSVGTMVFGAACAAVFFEASLSSEQDVRARLLFLRSSCVLRRKLFE